MKNKLIKIFIVLFAPYIIQAGELQTKDPSFGTGRHLSWEEIYNGSIDRRGLISVLTKGEWTYEARLTLNECLEVSRVNRKQNTTESLFNFNNNLKTDNIRIEPARIVDVFEGDGAIALLLAVPKGYIYILIQKNIDRHSPDYLVLPPAGVGVGAWLVTKFITESTTFGLHIPELGPDTPIMTLALVSLDELILQQRGLTEPVRIHFGGSEILKNGKAITGTVKSSRLQNPSLIPTGPFGEEIINIEKNLTELRVETFRKKLAATEGGYDYVMREMKTKLKGNKKALEAIERVEARVIDKIPKVNSGIVK